MPQATWPDTGGQPAVLLGLSRFPGCRGHSPHGGMGSEMHPLRRTEFHAGTLDDGGEVWVSPTALLGTCLN